MRRRSAGKIWSTFTITVDRNEIDLEVCLSSFAVCAEKIDVFNQAQALY